MTTFAIRPVPLAIACLLLGGGVLGACHATTSPGSDTTAATATTPSPPPAARKESAMSTRSDAVAVDRLPASGVMIDVTSRSLQAQAAIPARHTAYGDGVSPSLHWTRVDAARSYALLVEDPDAHGATPFVHWLAWNIPANVQSLPEGLPPEATPAQPAGMHQGRNAHDGTGYYGPHPPAGDPPHHYHFEVFALDAPLDLPANADRDALVAAIAPHVIGKGELVATSQAPH